MRYSVAWDDSALEDLADLWTQAADRQAVRDAANRVDGELAFSPETRGVDFYGDRLLVEPPLQVVYKVVPADRKVIILQVW
jgi:plasmid stabilization system protein ParE